MALYYGKTEEEKVVMPKQRKYLTYSWTYSANSNGLRKRPAELIAGHPIPYASTYGLNEDSTLTFLTHKFDTDDTIGTSFILEYKTWCLHRSGKAYSKVVFKRNLPANHRVDSTNIFALNHTIKFKDIVGWYKGMIGFQIETKCTGGTTNGCESVLDILVTI